MSDEQEGPSTGSGTGDGTRSGTGDGTAGESGRAREPIGSVGEEAAKLFSALSDLARDRGGDLGATAAGFSEALKDANDHIAHGEDCRYCPLCQVIRVVRETSPEVKTHLAVAASSLMQAAAGLLNTQVPDEREPGVEHIDLSDDSEDWEDE